MKFSLYGELVAASSLVFADGCVGVENCVDHCVDDDDFFDLIHSPTNAPFYRSLMGLVFSKEYNRQSDRHQYELHLPRARPQKVADIKFPASSLNRATARAVSTNVLKGSLGAIPFYGPPQVVNAVLERIFDFTDVLHLQHQAEALNLILERLGGSIHVRTLEMRA